MSMDFISSMRGMIIGAIQNGNSAGESSEEGVSLTQVDCSIVSFIGLTIESPLGCLSLTHSTPYDRSVSKSRLN